MQIKEQQQRDSIRFVWNAIASNKVLQKKAIIPQALHYSPLEYNQNSILSKPPLTCQKCGSYMNPYNKIALGKLNFVCCICKVVHKLPENYFEDNQKMPPQLTLAYSTFLIARNQQTKSKEIGFVFLVDITLSEKELITVKQSILDLSKTLDDNKTVALITYNKYVQLYELNSEIDNIFTFTPNQHLGNVQFFNLLSIKRDKAQSLQNKFISKLQNCRSVFAQKIQNLQKVKEAGYKAARQSRAVGQALNVALLLCQISQIPLKIIFFCGGICTIGVGKVIDCEFQVEVRSIKQQLPKQSISAIQFYKKLGQRAKIKSIAIDSFIFSVEEVGLTQMLPCLKATNGLLVQHQEFSSEIFKQSFHKAYIGSQNYPSLSLATKAWIQFRCSNQIQIIGFQGKQINLQQKDKQNSRIYLGNINQTTTISAIFQQTGLNTDSQAFYIQIRTFYRDNENLHIQFQRVTTIRRPFVQTHADIIASFDQEAALYLLAKLCVSYPLHQKSDNIRKWLDNLTIKWATMFGLYRKGVWQSFQLPANVRLFPQFIYYLRRNIVVRKSRVSLDQYGYICEIMKWETLQNVLLIIQPAMLMYTPEKTSAVPVGLDQKYMKSEAILILDSFFNIVQWRGKNIQGWYQQNYHLSNEYGYMQELYQNTNKDIDQLKSDRFPSPTLYISWPNHSKQRFIKSRLGNRQDEQQESNISEQADIKSFMSKLIQIVVNN